MKKIFISLILAAVLACFAGCGNNKRPVDTLNITENTFLTQLTEIYDNPSSYIGKTIKIAGLFEADDHGGHSHYYVYRNAPVYDSDHGHDHIQKIGFEFSYNGKSPKDNDFIEVVGVLRNYSENGRTSLRLEANSVTVLSVRGAETIGGTTTVHDEH